MRTASATPGRRHTDDPTGFVYAVTNPAWPGYVKIGSAGNIDHRLSSYQTSCPHRAFRLEASAYVADRRKVEQDLMLHLRKYKHQHEWFRVDVEVVARMLSSLQRKGTR